MRSRNMGFFDGLFRREVPALLDDPSIRLNNRGGDILFVAGRSCCAWIENSGK
jgi:hypothetical protein